MVKLARRIVNKARHIVARIVKNPAVVLGVGALVALSAIIEVAYSLPEEIEEGAPHDIAGECMVALIGLLIVVNALKDLLGAAVKTEKFLREERHHRPGGVGHCIEFLEKKWYFNAALGVLCLVAAAAELVEAIRESEEGVSLWYGGLLIVGASMVLKSLGDLSEALARFAESEKERHARFPLIERLHAFFCRPRVGILLSVLVIAFGVAEMFVGTPEEGPAMFKASHGIVMLAVMRLLRIASTADVSLEFAEGAVEEPDARESQ
ncbi:MAG: hypothetical protein RDV41_10130 [Planctomycetota bacterium]|nr:hypothetical protein [Planctomycetota bacterium]